MKKDEERLKWNEIIAKCWINEDFKKEFIQNPGKICKAHGIDLHGLKCRVVEDTSDEFYFVIPEKPKGHFQEEDLRKIAGGWYLTCCPTNNPTNSC